MVLFHCWVTSKYDWFKCQNIVPTYHHTKCHHHQGLKMLFSTSFQLNLEAVYNCEIVLVLKMLDLLLVLFMGVNALIISLIGSQSVNTAAYSRFSLSMIRKLNCSCKWEHMLLFFMNTLLRRKEVKKGSFC